MTNESFHNHFVSDFIDQTLSGTDNIELPSLACALMSAGLLQRNVFKPNAEIFCYEIASIEEIHCKIQVNSFKNCKTELRKGICCLK